MYASAHEGDNGYATKRSPQAQGQAGRAGAAGAVTIGCPDVGAKLTSVPDRAKG
ncbi:hypothetical protein ACFY4I_21295 [Streptomyces scabiei]|uniref:hypothetical protein n=1 Tax=Streptomyces scabiei TaxID=1930 RepID=UPI003698AF94